MADTLTFGPLTGTCAHLCVDMQRLFAEPTDWHAPWMRRVLPQVQALAGAHPDRTFFTRFIPARQSGDGRGSWKAYYERWASMTVERIGEPMLELVPELAGFVPPGELVDKTVYSPFVDTDLDDRLKRRGVESVIVTGGETDVCVLATVLGAVDRGYRVVVASDALCSSSDEAHDASLQLYETRYGSQVEIVPTRVILEAWR